MARTVLLADDSVTAQNMGRRILMDAGYDVITVNNGSAALKKIHESKPDLIVLDVYMPGYGGLEVCQRLKESTETMKIPVLLTVGKMEPFKAEEAKRVRADAHIVKPFDASELLAALTRLEDRIVPADARANGKPKKAHIWHSDDPAKNFDDSKTEQIAYLAEVKKRHVQSEPEGAEASNAKANAPAVPAPESSDAAERATLATAAESVETPSLVAEPAPEFLVQKESAAEFQTEPSPGLPLQATAGYQFPTNDSEAAPAVETKSRWIAENVALTAEEAALELDREMKTAQATASSADGSVADEPVAAPAQGSVTDASPSPESSGERFSGEPDPPVSAFAAAASAGAPAMAESTLPSAASAPEPPVPSEAAAAWENWQHIRDTVMTPQNTAAIAASIAEIAQATGPATAVESPQDFSGPHSSSEPQPCSEPGTPPLSEGQSRSVELAESSSDAFLEGDSLSSIVDSVLAELKPKLMQEIARKLKK